jgi:hypothetical protein
MRADEEFGGEVGDRARALLRVLGGRAHPPLQQAVAHDVRQREVIVALGRERRELALHEEKTVEERALERFLVEPGALALGRGWDRAIGRLVH